jgi:hypothetical protein
LEGSLKESEHNLLELRLSNENLRTIDRNYLEEIEKRIKIKENECKSILIEKEELSAKINLLEIKMMMMNEDKGSIENMKGKEKKDRKIARGNGSKKSVDSKDEGIQTEKENEKQIKEEEKFKGLKQISLQR